MPDYEYRCQRCKQDFAAHQSVKEHDERPAECPTCRRNDKVEKLISHFNVQTTRKSTAYV